MASLVAVNPMKTGITATKLAIAAFIVPYIFAMNPAMLLIDATVIDVLQITLSSCMGMLGVCMGLMGYFASNLNMPLRLLSIFGGLLMIIPGTMTDVVGLAIVAVVIIISFLMGRKQKVALV